MEKFNLERALAGEKVITRDGQEVSEIYHFKKAKNRLHRIVALINDKVINFTINGHFFSDKTTHPSDLFMAPKVLECWVNVYEDNNRVTISPSFSTKEIAFYRKGKKSTYIKTIRITNEKDNGNNI